LGGVPYRSGTYEYYISEPLRTDDLKGIGAFIQADLEMNLVKYTPKTTPSVKGSSFKERLLPAPLNSGYKDTAFWIWCGSVIKGDDNKYHMFASRWTRQLPFGPHWLTNSEIVHCVSDTPEGPYIFSEAALPPRGEQFWDGKMTHNPAIRKHGDTYLLYYTGTTYKGEAPSPGHPTTETSELKLDAHHHERIGLATSKSPFGPWERRDTPIIDIVPNSWDRYLTSNAAPFVFDDGRVMLYYKGVTELKKHAISVVFADHWNGTYKRLSDQPLNVGVGAEDPNIWFEDGEFHALMLDHDKKYSDKELYYATSKDGLKWTISDNPVGVSKMILYQNGKTRKMNSTERPWVLVENGKATHVFFATGETINGRRHTWNMCIPLKK
jgi:hypothetical protein